MAKAIKKMKPHITAKEVKNNLIKAAALLNNPSMRAGASGRPHAAGVMADAIRMDDEEQGIVTTTLFQAFCNTIGENIGNSTSVQETANSEANQHRLQTGHSVTVITSVK